MAYPEMAGRRSRIKQIFTPPTPARISVLAPVVGRGPGVEVTDHDTAIVLAELTEDSEAAEGGAFPAAVLDLVNYGSLARRRPIRVRKVGDHPRQAA